MPTFLSRALFWKVLVVASLFGGLATAEPAVKIEDPGQFPGLGGMLPGSLPSGLDFRESAPKPQTDMLAAAGLKLPTTWDYVRGFTQGGTDAWRAVQGLRGNRARPRGRNRPYPPPYDPHAQGFYSPQPQPNPAMRGFRVQDSRADVSPTIVLRAQVTQAET